MEDLVHEQTTQEEITLEELEREEAKFREIRDSYDDLGSGRTSELVHGSREVAEARLNEGISNFNLAKVMVQIELKRNPSNPHFGLAFDVYHAAVTDFNTVINFADTDLKAKALSLKAYALLDQIATDPNGQYDSSNLYYEDNDRKMERALELMSLAVDVDPDNEGLNDLYKNMQLGYLNGVDDKIDQALADILGFSLLNNEPGSLYTASGLWSNIKNGWSNTINVFRSYPLSLTYDHYVLGGM